MCSLLTALLSIDQRTTATKKRLDENGWAIPVIKVTLSFRIIIVSARCCSIADCLISLVMVFSFTTLSTLKDKNNQCKKL